MGGQSNANANTWRTGGAPQQSVAKLFTIDEARAQIASERSTAITAQPTQASPAAPRVDTPGKVSAIPAYLSKYMSGKIKKGWTPGEVTNALLGGTNILGQ